MDSKLTAARGGGGRGQGYEGSDFDDYSDDASEDEVEQEKLLQSGPALPLRGGGSAHSVRVIERSSRPPSSRPSTRSGPPEDGCTFFTQLPDDAFSPAARSPSATDACAGAEIRSERPFLDVQSMAAEMVHALRMSHEASDAAPASIASITAASATSASAPTDSTQALIAATLASVFNEAKRLPSPPQLPPLRPTLSPLEPSQKPAPAAGASLFGLAPLPSPLDFAAALDDAIAPAMASPPPPRPPPPGPPPLPPPGAASSMNLFKRPAPLSEALPKALPEELCEEVSVRKPSPLAFSHLPFRVRTGLSESEAESSEAESEAESQQGYSDDDFESSAPTESESQQPEAEAEAEADAEEAEAEAAAAAEVELTEEERVQRAEKAAEAARRKPWQERMKEASALYQGSRPVCWPATDMRSLMGAMPSDEQRLRWARRMLEVHACVPPLEYSGVWRSARMQQLLWYSGCELWDFALRACPSALMGGVRWSHRWRHRWRHRMDWSGHRRHRHRRQAPVNPPRRFRSWTRQRPCRRWRVRSI
jgi:hypothetical protein